jgi:glucans biosynthesis protein C
MNPSQTTRLFFVDWLRIFALSVLWWFHSGLIFTEKMNFHIKNPVPIPYLDDILFFFHEWRLALLFFVSGVATYYLLQKKVKGFLVERWKRLGIPLVFGILVIVPPQIYIERIFNGFEYESYEHFYWQSFQNGFYPHGDISWHHLWFIAYLLCYVSIFVGIRSVFKFLSNKLYFISVYKSITYINKNSFSFFLWAIPLMMAEVILKPYSSGVQNIIQDSAKFTFYLLIFSYGYAIASNPNNWHKIKSQKYIYLFFVIICFTVIYIIRWSELGLVGKVLFPYYTALRAFNTWFCILALVGFSATYLNFSHSWLPMLNRAVLPMYMLHQTAIIIVGYYLIQFSFAPILKWFLIVTLSFLSSWVLYRYFIAPYKITSFIFGLKTKKDKFSKS